MYRSLRQWLSFKVILGAILFALIIFGVLLGVLWSAKGKAVSMPPATAILSIIAAPTITPPAPITTSTPTPEPTSAQNEPPSGDIAVGDYIQVTGTGGDGLRVHETAGVTSKVQYIAIDSEVFLVQDGPIEADGYTWWLLQDPYTENAVGWGVANYLAIVSNQ
jgi:ABC-type transport system involved in multi-copper enzyme maturation permease subunit